MAKKLPTINIKGKEYVQVKDRLVAFQELYPEGSIHTEILSNDEQSVVVRATVRTKVGIDGRSFTGHSEAYRTGTMKDVPVEVAETSAVGRALGMLGIGIIESVASADEMVKSSYARNPAPGRTEAPKRELSMKQKNMLKIKIFKTGKPMPDEEWFDSLDYATFNASLTKLKGLPETEKGWPSNLDQGDQTPDIEGDKETDYNHDTGALL